MPTQIPWAVLLCKFQDFLNEPPNSIQNVDFETTTRRLFTSDGIFTENVVNYFYTVSHQQVDMSNSQVFGWFTLDNNTADLIAPAPLPPGWTPSVTRQDMIAKAKAAARNAGVLLDDFKGVIVLFNIAVGISQGGTNSDGGDPQPWVFADFRYVNGNGTSTFGHECGHGYGLSHSRADHSNYNPVNCNSAAPDYRDPWDIMSALCTYQVKDPIYSTAGPGLNAWYMRQLKWLDETRVFHAPNNTFSQVITLRPLHQLGLPGTLTAELPIASDPTGASKYLIEYRNKNYWDAGYPRSGVFVHRFDGVNTYLKFSLTDQADMQKGDIFIDRFPSTGTAIRVTRMTVLDIDDAQQTATINLCYTTNPAAASVSIYMFPPALSCSTPPAEGSTVTYSSDIVAPPCTSVTKIQWSIQGANPSPGETGTNKKFSFIAPRVPEPFTVSILMTFDDGTTASASKDGYSLTAQEVALRLFICNLPRLKPIPWWEWDPEFVIDPAGIFSREQIAELIRTSERMIRFFQNFLNRMEK